MTRVTLRSTHRPTDLGQAEGCTGGGGPLTAEDGEVGRWVSANPAAITAAAIAMETRTPTRRRRDTGRPMDRRLLEFSLTQGNVQRRLGLSPIGGQADGGAVGGLDPRRLLQKKTTARAATTVTIA